jgi:thiol-disulfide isomerase/thioredoxin
MHYLASENSGSYRESQNLLTREIVDGPLKENTKLVLAGESHGSRESESLLTSREKNSGVKSVLFLEMLRWGEHMKTSSLRKPRTMTLFVVLVSVLDSVTSRAAGQTAEAPAQPPALPARADQWINSVPLTYDGLRGKAAILWYFEETCPKVMGEWPAMKKLAADNADKPVMFIGVNSGTSRSAVQAYLKRHAIDWPVIVDYDRSFERASGVQEISLSNIYQVRMVTADGRFVTGRWDKLPEVVEKTLVGAKWKMPYDRVPEALHPAMRRIEYGDYGPADSAIRNGLKDKSPEVRKAAKQLRAYIDRQINSALQEALASAPATDTLARYEAYSRVAQKFSPHELSKEAADEMKRLAANPAVKEEILAAKAVDANAAAISSSDTRMRERATTVLQRVAEKYPKTRAGAQAKKLLSQSQPAPMTQ